jgi:predicted nucleic acid-binding protein
VSKIFIDTNILVYTVDDRDRAKKRRAREVISRLGADRQPVISTQVVHEFYVAVTKKLRVDPLDAKKLVHALRTIEIVNGSFELAEQAIDICILNQLSYWDSLIVASAEKAKCEFLFSEDLAAGATYRGVKILNPFQENEI